MSVFDLFRGFFGVPGGHYRGDGRRDPFFDGMTHDDDDDDDDDDAYQEDGFPHDGYRGDQRDYFDNSLRFGFSFGPSGMRIDEPPLFGHVLRGMEEIFSHLGRFEEEHHFDAPGITSPPSHEGPDKNGQRSSSGNALRDSMLKSEEDTPQRPRGPRGPRDEDVPRLPSAPFHGWSPFSDFNDIWKQGPKGRPEARREDGDLDSAVSSRGLDTILSLPPSESPGQPRSRSYFQSVTVTKVVKPDGSVEERHTVRDGQGNEETTVTRSGPTGNPEPPGTGDRPLGPGGGQLFSDLRDDGSMFSRFFGGFK